METNSHESLEEENTQFWRKINNTFLTKTNKYFVIALTMLSRDDEVSWNTTFDNEKVHCVLRVAAVNSFNEKEITFVMYKHPYQWSDQCMTVGTEWYNVDEIFPRL